MTAAYRLKGVGWFGGCVAVVLGFYLVSLQVAAERKKLETVNGQIRSAERDIRALETEFDTRANLAQLERWNGDTLALSAPTAGQFVASESALASLDVNQIGGPAGATVQTAQLLVPSLPVAAAAAAPQAVDVAVQAVAAAAPLKPVTVRATVQTARATDTAIVRAVAPERLAAVAKVRPQAVAMLDRKLLSDNTLGSILSGARAEAGRLR
ncbi:hypothetical protein IFT54_05945 [Sphingomonas sp. CFBP 13714]|uniref:hypothetical protein n=1 Tax=Sphingomonas sp. CFBP 13714 TaxID=2775308 RepID=UPI00177DB759|nr:hypothetical protein [Sphingomonas sp. CFBP 13714]MBD8699356.1 hypothetical protein [Sphingomonas sp. CFBP 13714]